MMFSFSLSSVFCMEKVEYLKGLMVTETPVRKIIRLE